MDQFNMHQFNDTPLSPLDEHPACPICGRELAHLQTGSSPLRFRLPFFFEFSLFHCATDGVFYRTRSDAQGRDNDSGVRAPRKRPPTLNHASAAVEEPD